jgi:hypothetical protein
MVQIHSPRLSNQMLDSLLQLSSIFASNKLPLIADPDQRFAVHSDRVICSEVLASTSIRYEPWSHPWL